MDAPPARQTDSIDVFLNPAGLFDRLVVLTPEAILVANPDPLAMARLSADPDPAAWAAALGERRTTIRYDAIAQIRTNTHRDTLTVRFKQHNRSRLMTISLKDSAARDAAWEALRRRVGRQFVFSDVQLGRVRAAVAPLLTAALGIGAAVVLHLAAAEAFVADILGPNGVVGLGVLAAAMAGVWGVARLRVPPRMLTLVRG
jgi:hypothetical protein